MSILRATASVLALVVATSVAGAQQTPAKSTKPDSTKHATAMTKTSPKKGAKTTAAKPMAKDTTKAAPAKPAVKK